MKFYLSSYELGNEIEKLKKLIPKGRIGYIPNARDFTGADPERRERRNKNDMQSLRELGLEIEMINLRDYFGKQSELKKKLEGLGAIFISGGNVFVLPLNSEDVEMDNLFPRHLMMAEGMDERLKRLILLNKELKDK